MNQSITIYISASPDLMAEREALARMIAELPASLPWHICQTPAEAEPIDDEAVWAASLYFLIMAGDIRAPVGVELHTARQANREVLGFLKQKITRTPAGEIFIRQAHLNWQFYQNTGDLIRKVQRIVVEHLIQQATRYALTPEEFIKLQRLLDTDSPQTAPSSAQGAGHSAVLLSPERFLPGQGVIIDE